MRDPIRELSPPAVNKAIDEATLAILECYKGATPEEIEGQLKALDEMWELECYVELATAVTTLSGLLLHFATGKRRWLGLAAIGGVASLLHSLPIPDPVTPLLRGFGIWTRQEIERERHALKLLRGDYERVAKDPSAKSALAVSQGEKGLKEPTGPVLH